MERENVLFIYEKKIKIDLNFDSSIILFKKYNKFDIFQIISIIIKQ